MEINRETNIQSLAGSSKLGLGLISIEEADSEHPERKTLIDYEFMGPGHPKVGVLNSDSSVSPQVCFVDPSPLLYFFLFFVTQDIESASGWTLSGLTLGVHLKKITDKNRE